MTAEEMWAVFFAKAAEPKYVDIIEKILKRREGISVANEMLRTISQDEFERARFHSRKMALQDAEHNRVTAIAFPFDISPQTSPKRRWSVRRFGSQMASQTWKCYIKEGRAEVFTAFEQAGADPELINRVTELIKYKKI